MADVRLVSTYELHGKIIELLEVIRTVCHLEWSVTWQQQAVNTGAISAVLIITISHTVREYIICESNWNIE